MKKKQIIITGLSGSGKSTAIDAFEDAGFFCVDNMPVALLPKFLELTTEEDTDYAGFVFVMDLREKKFLSSYPAVFETLVKKGYELEIYFLEADDAVLVRRFSQTRRHHPLDPSKSLTDCIRMEREQLKELRNTAKNIIDTSAYTVHDLKAKIFDIIKRMKHFNRMWITVMSFGFKYGIPNEADLVMDVRFLANPYFVPELQDLDGETDAVRNYVLDRDETRDFLKRYLNLIDFLIPKYEKEGKAYLTIATGCTGGKHRSVAVARKVFEHIEHQENRIQIIHRDIKK